MHSRPIQQLPSDLVNRIAAGEVIERPASVVKELVENAVDAGATRITVEIEDGGKSLVRVTDDGGGIPASELPLAFAQHATSKVRDDAELAAVTTMGFRGEALASIGSVSRARILSRRGGEPAHEVRDDGGRVSAVQPAAGNAGTTVEVRDLFFNVPARRKFLKAAAAESGQVTDMLVRLALARPEVSFRYERDGRLVSDWPAGTLVGRLLVAWPREYHDGAIRIEVSDDRHGDGLRWHLGGVVGLPEFAATTGRYQHLYVNGRPVRDRSAAHAVREAYRGLTEPGRHPAAVLLLTVPPGEVDVNVHPTKAEVRFRDGGRLWGLIHSAVREALLGADLVPKAQPRVAESAADGPRPDLRDTLADFFRNALGQAQHRLPEDDPNAVAPPTRQVTAPFPAEVSPPRVEDAAISPSVRALQLHNSYLVVQSDDGMEIIDQHALHERVLFEELLTRLRRGPLESQRLLLPATFDAPEVQVALLDELRPVLSTLGIEADAFGPTTVAVQAFPSFLEKLDPADFVAGVLEKAEADVKNVAGNDEEVLHDVLDLMACKAAVKAGDPLTQVEIDALVRRRGLTRRSSNCPHGRPTTLKLSLGDLEKQFKRTGF